MEVTYQLSTHSVKCKCQDEGGSYLPTVHTHGVECKCQEEGGSYLPVWPPSHMVGSTLLIFSISSNCSSLSVGSGEMPSRTRSDVWPASRRLEVEVWVGVLLPEEAGEPVARYILGPVSSSTDPPAAAAAAAAASPAQHGGRCRCRGKCEGVVGVVKVAVAVVEQKREWEWEWVRVSESVNETETQRQGDKQTARSDRQTKTETVTER